MKVKFKCICDKLGIRKCYMFFMEEVFKVNLGICMYMEFFLNVCYDIVVV